MTIIYEWILHTYKYIYYSKYNLRRLRWNINYRSFDPMVNHFSCYVLTHVENGFNIHVHGTKMWVNLLLLFLPRSAYTEITYQSKFSELHSKKDSVFIKPAQFTNPWKIPRESTACFVFSQSLRSTHAVAIVGYCLFNSSRLSGCCDNATTFAPRRHSSKTVSLPIPSRKNIYVSYYKWK